MNALTILPAKSNIQPKPTKTEIVTAMATLHIQKLEKENKEIDARREALQEKIHNLMLATVKKDGFKTLLTVAQMGNRWGSSKTISSVHLEVDFPMSPDSEITQLLDQYHDCKRLLVPDMKTARRYIMERMEVRASGETRIKQLLEDTEYRKALDSALKAIE